ncbi:MAG TPA: spondin domain-containing protein, partial [bacterium]
MRKSSALFVLLLIAMMGLGAGCNGSNASLATFLLTIANIGPVYHSSGVFNTPVGETAAAPAGPGQGYEFNFKAGPGSFLSFATMMVQTNDKFFAPLPSGIELFPGGDPVDADITSMVYLWDAGTEVDAEPGTGPDQPPRESGPNTGADQGGVVEMANDGFTYPDVDQVVQVTITPVDPLVVPTEFMVEINNVSVAGQLSTSMGDVDIPISPGVWVVHSSPAPLFDDGVADYGYGLEAIAEDGDPSGLGTYLAGNSGLVSPIAPGVWVSAN